MAWLLSIRLPCRKLLLIKWLLLTPKSVSLRLQVKWMLLRAMCIVGLLLCKAGVLVRVGGCVMSLHTASHLLIVDVERFNSFGIYSHLLFLHLGRVVQWRRYVHLIFHISAVVQCVDCLVVKGLGWMLMALCVLLAGEQGLNIGDTAITDLAERLSSGGTSLNLLAASCLLAACLVFYLIHNTL